MKDYTVMIESEGGTEYELMDFDSIKEARQFCNEYDWYWADENNFHWEMSIRDNRF
jgi:hypothetical protein